MTASFLGSYDRQIHLGLVTVASSLNEPTAADMGIILRREG